MAKQNEHEGTIVKRVSRKHDDEGHGGAWKVAFADFCLALMCLFLVLWVMAARDKEQLQLMVQSDNGKMLGEGTGRMTEAEGGPKGSMIDRESMHQYDKTSVDPERDLQLSKTRYESPSDLKELAVVLEHLSQQSGLAGNLQTVVTPYGLRVMLHDTDKQGMFERGSAIPSERFRLLLRKIGPVFAQIENQMLIVGHTDSLQYASHNESVFSNWTLSSQRAMTARTQLLSGGMSQNSVLQVVGMADRAPLDVKNPMAGVNRRIELLILTSGQSRAVSSMFGVSGDVVSIVEGVDTALPDSSMLSELRNRLLPAKVSTSIAHLAGEK